ncbi:MAG: hypothetical protein M1837_001993 [Sclerophora amabilis]|nr:MAG: hypothetical protein M1837_001993 [Sclerophora amabilis]
MGDPNGIPVTLLDLLSNTLILSHTAPYVPVSAFFSLGATSAAFHSLIFHTPHVFQYLDLSVFKKTAATPFEQIDSGGVFWRHQQMDEAITEEDFYSGPLRGIFGKLDHKGILQDVQTLILDGLSAPAELINEIIIGERFNIRILSIREAKNLNEHKLMQVLRFAVRPSRPDGVPRLKGLYVFGSKDPKPLGQGGTVTDPWSSGGASKPIPSTGVNSSIGAQIGAEWNQKPQRTLSSSLGQGMDHWYSPGKRIRQDSTLSAWADTLQDCQGIIAFDAILCRGPRHHFLSASNFSDSTSSLNISSASPLPPQIANVALPPTGCARCHTSPEDPACFPSSPSSHFPLFAPPPLHRSTTRAAQIPPTPSARPPPPLFLRCEACLLDRFCERCHKWWCEACYSGLRRDKRTTMQAIEQVEDALVAGWQWGGEGESSIKVHLGLCVEGCLVGEMMAGSGEGGMWG